MTFATHAADRRRTPPATPTVVLRRYGRQQLGGPPRALQRLSIGPVTDPAEREAERMAAAVTSAVPAVPGAAAPAPVRCGPVIRRQPPGAQVDPVDVFAKFREDRAAAARTKALGLVFEELSAEEPLKSVLAKGKEVWATPEGKIAVGGFLASVVAAHVVADRELPITTVRIPVGKDIALKPVLKGSPRNPTEAGGEVIFGGDSGPSVSLGGKAGSTTTPQGSIGIGYTGTKGRLAGFEANVNLSVDSGGRTGANFMITYDLGALRKKRQTGQERPPVDTSPTDQALDPSIRRSPAPGDAGTPASVPTSVHAALARPGIPLPGDVRASMEGAFGADFSGVQVHADGAAAGSATEVGALAYTVGPHVVFGPGRWPPTTAAQRHTLAHELAHVVQQGAARPIAAGEMS